MLLSLLGTPSFLSWWNKADAVHRSAYPTRVFGDFLSEYHWEGTLATVVSSSSISSTWKWSVEAGDQNTVTLSLVTFPPLVNSPTLSPVTYPYSVDLLTDTNEFGRGLVPSWHFSYVEQSFLQTKFANEAAFRSCQSGTSGGIAGDAAGYVSSVSFLTETSVSYESGPEQPPQVQTPGPGLLPVEAGLTTPVMLALQPQR